MRARRSGVWCRRFARSHSSSVATAAGERFGDDAIVTLWTAAAVADLRFVQTAETVRELAMNGLPALRSAAEVDDVPRGRARRPSPERFAHGHASPPCTRRCLAQS